MPRISEDAMVSASASTRFPPDSETISELNRLSNRELADLVQKKSVGLATEAVDEFRSRTVSADVMAENIVRRILRRPPRTELPEAAEDIRRAVAANKLDSA